MEEQKLLHKFLTLGFLCLSGVVFFQQLKIWEISRRLAPLGQEGAVSVDTPTPEYPELIGPFQVRVSSVEDRNVVGEATYTVLKGSSSRNVTKKVTLLFPDDLVITGGSFAEIVPGKTLGLVVTRESPELEDKLTVLSVTLIGTE